MDRTPITVEVKDGRWEAFGTSDCYRHHWLYQLLKRNGGINEGVPEGTYHFNARMKFPFKVVMTLDPAE